MNRLGTIFLMVLSAATSIQGATTFRVTIDPMARTESATGRLVVYVKKPTTQPTRNQTLDGFDHLFGVDVPSLRAGESVDVDDRSSSYPLKPGALPPGKYVAQAVLDMHQDDSNWRREPGNLYSPVVSFSTQDSTVNLSLSNIIKPIEYPPAKQGELFEMRSKLLSDFHHRDIFLRAGVIFPRDYDPSRKYAAIYRIPGSGGDGISILNHPETSFEKGPGGDQLAKECFHIWLDPESGNGHTLLCNSDNNGPRGDAIVRELIPALEAKYPLTASADARIVHGHSSGGWAALWLTLQYPEVFGACFAVSPDPVDFHNLELIDIYNMPNAYNDGKRDLPGSRSPNARSVRDENAIEEVIGPHNTSGQDWDAWQACWGRRDSSGHVASLYEPITGAIDHAEAESYRRYDITDLLRNNPDRFAPIFHRQIRLIVGDRDTFFLNDAVVKLKAELDRHPSTATTGYIRILPGYDHGTILSSPDALAWPREMADCVGNSK